MEQHLGYVKHDYENKNTSNSRNGKSTKTMKSNLGLFDLDVPRDREGSFEPAIVKKHQTDGCYWNVCKRHDYKRYSNSN